MKKYILVSLVASALFTMAFTSFRFDGINPHLDPEEPLGYVMSDGELSCLGCHQPVIFKKPTVNDNDVFYSGYEVGKIYEFNLSLDVSDKFKGIEYYTTANDINSGEVRDGVKLIGDGQYQSFDGSDEEKNHAYALAVAENVGVGKQAQTITIQWQAPNVAEGPVTISFAGVAADGDGTAEGDMVFETKFELSPKEKIANGNELSLYPSIASNSLHISYTLNEDSPVELLVFDLNGQLMDEVISYESAGSHKQQLEIGDNYSNGIYLIQTRIGEEISTKRFVVSK